MVSIEIGVIELIMGMSGQYTLWLSFRLSLCSVENVEVGQQISLVMQQNCSCTSDYCGLVGNVVIFFEDVGVG